MYLNEKHRIIPHICHFFTLTHFLSGNFTLKSAWIYDKKGLATKQRKSIFCVKLHTVCLKLCTVCKTTHSMFTVCKVPYCLLPKFIKLSYCMIDNMEENWELDCWLKYPVWSLGASSSPNLKVLWAEPASPSLSIYINQTFIILSLPPYQTHVFWYQYYLRTGSLGALRAQTSSWRPLTLPFTPFGHSGRVTHVTVIG